MKSWVDSYAVWVAWIALFLVLELTPFVWKGCLWDNLSGTAWHAERTYHVVRVLLLGFLVGLAIHIVFAVGFWKSMLFGLGFSLLTHLIHLRKP